MRQVIQLFLPLATEKGITLDMERADSVPSAVVGDLGRIQQVLRNLISNALKFTEEGHISVMVKATTDSDTPSLYLAVEDTGIGIPKDKLDAIFDKFTQADASVTRKFGGTGLGLAITQQLVELMDGDIGVDSLEGQGSTFWFTIPLAEVNDTDKLVNLYDEKSGLSNEALQTDLRLLAVDDHPVNQTFVRKLLKKLGFNHVDLAENVQEALNMIEKNTYDIVLMDCQMPELDGYQATTLLRQREEGTDTHLPVIALTANAMMGDKEKCLKAGMDDYLSKPIKPDQLMALLKKWAPVPSDSKDNIEIDQGAKNEIENDDVCGLGADDIENRHYETPDPKVHDLSMDEFPVDREHLAIFTDGDPNEEQELLTLFFEQADFSIAALKDAVENDNHEEWKKASHRLKGSAANLGANPLSRLCADAEANPDMNQDDKKTLLNAMARELQNITVFMSQTSSEVSCEPAYGLSV